MRKIAKYLKTTKKDEIVDQRLYFLPETPMPYITRLTDEGEYEWSHTHYIVVSKRYADDYIGHETFIFPANSDGTWINAREMPGSYSSTDISHYQVLADLGYEVE